MKRVLFIQLPPPRFSFEASPANIPLAAGFLMSALEVAGRTALVPEALHSSVADVFADRGLLEKIVENKPAVVAFTLYVWNVERSLFLASGIKRNLPGVFVIVGGPEVTPDNRWVLEHPAVDAGIFGEGESRIASVLEALINKSEIRSIPACFAKDGDNVAVNTHHAASWNLAACQYPYLDGRISPAQDGTLFLETVRGCPFQCRYCYYHKTFAGMRFHPANSIEKVLDFAYSRDSGVREIYLMDPTFNARKGFRDILTSMAARRQCNDLALHTELRSDLLNIDDVRLLGEAGLKSAEVGLQTVNPEALALAGRTGDPDKIAAGVHLLKNAGIDVTTGIILGLPGDTPDGFKRTIEWLRNTEAYSVVHPFVLSVLPGTDFRSRASELHLAYDLRPPYYVRSTSAFPEKEFQPALVACEDAFGMELDYIPPPSLVDRGSGVVVDMNHAGYISKWIVDIGTREPFKALAQVIPRATDPFTFWFKGVCKEDVILSMLERFTLANPHAVVHVVLEFSDAPRTDFLRDIVKNAANPEIFINRSYRPLFGDAVVVSLQLTVIFRDPGSGRARKEVGRTYESLAFVVWETAETNEAYLSTLDLPCLISWPRGKESDYEPLMRLIAEVFGNHPEEVLFRDESHSRLWASLTRQIDPKARLPEKILHF